MASTEGNEKKGGGSKPASPSSSIRTLVSSAVRRESKSKRQSVENGVATLSTDNEEDSYEDGDDEEEIHYQDDNSLGRSDSDLAEVDQPDGTLDNPQTNKKKKKTKIKSVFNKRLLQPIKHVKDTAKQVVDTANPVNLVSRAEKRISSSIKPPRAPSGGTFNDGRQSNTTASTLTKEGGNDEAEDSLLRSIESRSRNTVQGSDGWRAAVPGEVPPLSAANLGIGLMGPSSDGGGVSSTATAKERTRAKWMNTVKALRSQKAISSTPNSTGGTDDHGNGAFHRRAHTLLAESEEETKKKQQKVNDTNSRNDFTFFIPDDDDIDAFHSILGDGSGRDTDHQDHDHGDDGDDDDDRNEGGFFDNVANHGSDDMPQPTERLPLLQIDENQEDNNVTKRMASPSERQDLKRRIGKIKRRWNAAFGCCHPREFANSFIFWFTHSSMIPALLMFLLAATLYYTAGNPSLDFLPGEATVSWWLNFFGRQLLLLEVSRFCKYLCVDCLVVSTRIAAKILGSWMTYFCIQSRDWPFVVACWGILDMILLHGDNEFQAHWLYWTDIGIYSKANSGSYILSSDRYLRVLVSMVFVGVTTTLKRTVVTLYFNRRKFEIYKPRLEEILNDIISISEVAELSADAEDIADTLGINKVDSLEDIKKAQKVGSSKRRPTHVRWSSVKFSSKKMDGSDTSIQDDTSVDTAEGSDLDTQFPNSSSFFGSFLSNGSSTIPIKELLIKWDEPVNVREKSYNATVNDILKFRKALTYMDLEHPFSEAFGPASTRNEMIASAELVYERLMRLSSSSVNLSFSVLELLSTEDDGSIDMEKLKTMRSLFRPNSKNELTLVSFAQACDTVYKKLRYLRASVGNSSVLDQVLESIIDSFFYFVIGLLILSFLELNPWSLLVSLSTLLVTASFAVGPTAAKAIEGMVLIVGRRPFDIGDRILISDNPGGPMPSMTKSWFVEDISLFSTTLRSAITNEISTVSNGSIANARITNCARSKNAVVHFSINFHLKCHRGHLIEKFRKGLDHYIAENPQVWDSVLVFRCDEINTDRECVTYALSARSRYTWQVCARVLVKQGELHRYCIDLAYKLGIKYDSPNARNILYHGGSLVDGGVQDFKADVLSNSNIINDGSTLDVSAGMLALTNFSNKNETRSNTTNVNNVTRKTAGSDSLETPDPRASFISSIASSSIPPRSPSPVNIDSTEPSDSSHLHSLGIQASNQENSAGDSTGREFLAMLQQSHND